MGLSTKSISNTVLELGTLEVPVAIHSATEQKDVAFQTASPEGNKVKRMHRDEETGEFYEEAELQKGIWVGDEFKPISKDAIDAIKAEGKLPSIKIDKTVPLKDLTPMLAQRTKGTYYVTTQTGGPGARSLRVIRDALKRSKSAAIGKFTLKGRQYPFALSATNGTLALTTMRFADSFRDSDQYAEAMEAVAADATVKAAVKMTTEIFEAMQVDASALDEYDDDAIPAKNKLLDEAVAGKPPKGKKAAEKKGAKESKDLMAELQKMADKEKVSA